MLDETAKGDVEGAEDLRHLGAAGQGHPAAAVFEVCVARAPRGEGVGFVLKARDGDDGSAHCRAIHFRKSQTQPS